MHVIADVVCHTDTVLCLSEAEDGNGQLAAWSNIVCLDKGQMALQIACMGHEQDAIVAQQQAQH